MAVEFADPILLCLADTLGTIDCVLQSVSVEIFLSYFNLRGETVQALLKMNWRKLSLNLNFCHPIFLLS